MKLLPCFVVAAVCSALSTSAFELPRPSSPATRPALSYENTLAAAVVSAEPGSSIAAASPRRARPTARTWVRRLNTKEDKFSLHKISGISFVLSSSFVLGTGAVLGFHEVPAWLQYADAAVLGSTACQFFTSVDMSIRHRKHQPYVRDQFLTMAANSMTSAVSATLCMPCPPGFLCDQTVFDVIMVPLLLTQIYATLSTAGNPQSLLLAREKSRRNLDVEVNVKAQADRQIVNYLVSTVLAAFVSAAFLYCLVNEPMHGRDWILNFAESHGGVGYFYYALVASNASTMYSALLLTLLDKKLVPKEWENSLGTVLMGVPSIILFVIYLL